MDKFLSTKLLTGFLLALSAIYFISTLDTRAAGQAVDSTLDDIKPVELKLSDDLAKVSKQASAKRLPVLLMFSMNHCPYCIEVEEDFLKPMLRNSDYDDKVVIRKVRLDGGNLMEDFKGRLRDPSEFSDEYNVSMVPTVIVVDPDGKPMAAPIIGLTNPYYYGYDLDQAIDKSLQQLRQVTRK